MIQFQCLHCLRKLSAPDAVAGTTNICGSCLGRVEVPLGSTDTARPASRREPSALIPAAPTQNLDSAPSALPRSVPIGNGFRPLIKANRELSAWREGVAWRFLGPVIGVALILLIGYFLLPKYSTGEKEDYDLWRTKVLTVACENYKIDHDEWPPNLEALIQPRAEEKPPYVEVTTLQSATGGLYQYDPTGSHHNGLKPDIWVETPNGPIGNWMPKTPR